MVSQVQQTKQIQSEKLGCEGEEIEDNMSNSEEKMEAAESKFEISIPQFQPKFSQQLTKNLKSQIISQSKKENKVDKMKQSYSQIKANIKETEIKKQDNLSDLTYQKSQIFKTQQLIQQNNTPQKQKKNIIQESSNQQVDESLQILNGKQFSKQLEQKLFSKQILNCREKNKNQVINKQIIQKIEQQIDDSLDFYKFFKEILFLKKAALVLLSKDQLAAIQLVGLDIVEIEPKNHKIQKDEDFCMNYIQEQFEILQSTELQSQYIKIFLQKCQNQLEIDQIDKRILSSLIINQEN
ncbi:hypothetical protein ABPG73_012850 [Tetrahymena malaccensis]